MKQSSQQENMFYPHTKSTGQFSMLYDANKAVWASVSHPSPPAISLSCWTHKQEPQCFPMCPETLFAPINRIFSQCVQHTLQCSGRNCCSAPLSALTQATIVKYWQRFAKNPCWRSPTCLLLCHLVSLVQLFTISTACSTFPATGLAFWVRLLIQHGEFTLSAHCLTKHLHYSPCRASSTCV